MRSAAMAFAMLLIPASAPAQSQMSRDEVLEHVSKEIAEIQTLYAIAGQGDVISTMASENRIDAALNKAEELRGFLSKTYYVRLTSVTIVVPWGIGFELEFLDDPSTPLKK